jgi:hypothetical protein
MCAHTDTHHRSKKINQLLWFEYGLSSLKPMLKFNPSYEAFRGKTKWDLHEVIRVLSS